VTSRIGKPNTVADEAVFKHIDKKTSFVMVAGAGSGKTTSLVKALAHITQIHGTTLKMRSQRVACITYTEIAREEIWKDVGENPLFQVSTIHSFFWNLIRSFREDIRAWIKLKVVEDISLEQVKIDNKRTHEKTKVAARAEIERLTGQIVRVDAVSNFKYGTGSDYEKGVLGHDDIIKLGPFLIMEKPLMRKIVAQSFPFIFVDESQDTLESVVVALTAVQQESPGMICLGFFGDQMQKIYTSKGGDIPLQAGWEKVPKPENFRCPPEVLKIVNNIRRKGDTLEQVTGRKWTYEGRARMFIAARAGDRSVKLDEVRKLLAEEHGDLKWLSDERDDGVRMLVIVHRMAALRLGFPKLFAAFNDNRCSNGLKEGFQKGKAWPLTPFLDYFLPLVKSQNESDGFSVITLLRKYSPLLEEESLKTTKAADLLSGLQKSVTKLTELIRPGSTTTVGQVIQFAKETKLLSLDRRWGRYMKETLEVTEKPEAGLIDASEDGEGTEDRPKDDEAINAFMAVVVPELFGYQKYAAEESPFATQHGIKGSEFERVLTVLDDEEGSYSLYSYDKYFGIVELSPTDQANIDAGDDSVISRTRRLFYVSCSRSTHELAVVLFADDPKFAHEKVIESEVFPVAQIKIV
jgi:DNA helicase-2/ATP-dependent DNA helicase PcrA